MSLEDERIERACEVMHDAYERAAVGAGWETQQASRQPWADVPEANKVTMRAAVAALFASPEISKALARSATIASAAPDLDRLRFFAEAATPGPWTTDDIRPRWITCPAVNHIKIDEADWGEEVGNQMMLRTVTDPQAWSYADTRFVAAANPAAVLALIDEIANLRLEVDKLENEIDGHRQNFRCFAARREP